MKDRLFLLLVALACGRAVSAAEPERADLFSAGEGGFAHYRIPGIAVTKRGAILAWCEARKGDTDWGEERLLMRRSTDAGKTWSAPRDLLTLPEPQPVNPLRIELRPELGNEQTNARTYHNAMLIPDRNGAVHAVFCIDYWRMFYARSDDDGLSFSAPVEITGAAAAYRGKGWDWRVIANGCGHGIQLENGRLIVPLWLSTSTQPRGHGHRPSSVGVLFSDDGGAKWTAGGWVARHEPPEMLTPNETCSVQLADGRVLFNIRHETPNHRRAISTSPDGATHWTKPAFDEALFDPVCEASILRVSKTPAADKNRILFCNPDSRPENPASKELSRRRNLTLKLSYDECRTWPARKVLEPGAAGYSDLAIDSHGTIYCFFERGTVRQGNRNRTAALTLAKFNLEWLEAPASPAQH